MKFPMLRFVASLGLCCSLAGIAWAAPGGSAKISDAALEHANSRPGEKIDVIVTFRTPPGHLARADVARLGGNVKRQFRLIPGLALSLPARAVERLADRPGVEWVTLDLPLQFHAKKSKDSGGDPPSGDGDDNPSRFTGAGVTVGLLDSGVDSRHADLAGQVIDEVNFVSGSQYSGDKWGHGTHVAGIIAGTGAASGEQYVGLATGAKIYSARVLESDGSGLTSDVIAGIEHLVSNKTQYDIKVINLSLGHKVIEPAAQDPLVQAVEAAWDAGIVVVTSAGNYGNDGYGTVTSPGNSRRVITVGSLTDWGTGNPNDDIVSTYSSRGPTLGEHLVKPDLLAPGNKVASLNVFNSDLDKLFPENRIYSANSNVPEYIYLSGTSMAAPKVTAVVAKMLEADPSLNPDTVKARLMRSATKPDVGDVFSTGAGLLDEEAALADSGWTEYAPSPAAYKDETSGEMGFDNTGVLWGGDEWSLAYIWSDSIIWSDSLVWGDSLIWSDSIVWGDSMIWSDTVTGQSALWGD